MRRFRSPLRSSVRLFGVSPVGDNSVNWISYLDAVQLYLERLWRGEYLVRKSALLLKKRKTYRFFDWDCCWDSRGDHSKIWRRWFGMTCGNVWGTYKWRRSTEEEVQLIDQQFGDSTMTNKKWEEVGKKLFLFRGWGYSTRQLTSDLNSSHSLPGDEVERRWLYSLLELEELSIVLDQWRWISFSSLLCRSSSGNWTPISMTTKRRETVPNNIII